jgi:formylmethanofuran dehydrogenase subunit E
MADDADMSDERIELAVASARSIISEAANAMPDGGACECERCGEFSHRCVEVYSELICAGCRDRYGLP